MELNEVQLCSIPKYTKITVFNKLHKPSFLRCCLMLDDGFKLNCSVDLKEDRGKRKN